jgi:hypothetical protein
MIYLSEFGFRIFYIPGVLNVILDILLRLLTNLISRTILAINLSTEINEI